MAVVDSIPRGPVTATINYFTPPADGSKPYQYVDKSPSPDIPQRNYTSEPSPTQINDARGRESSFTLDRDAFKILQGVPPSAEKDFIDEESIKKNYYPEVEKILLDNVPGAHKVRIFDHTIRRQRKDADRQPVPYAHVDQTAPAVVQRVRRYYTDEAEAEALLAGRYRIINVWRTLNAKPLESFPLAYASSASAADDDFVPTELRYLDGYVGETAGIRRSGDQRWYYLSGMTGDERILLECFDSESLKPGSGVRGQVPHSAFEDPRTRPGAEARESIEVRALVFGP